jgi:hypothetical protein
MLLLCGALALVNVLYLVIYIAFLPSSELTWTSNYDITQAKVGVHQIYNWINHQSAAYSGDEYEFQTTCPNWTPKHLYVLRHTERLDFVYNWWSKDPSLVWTQRAFNESGTTKYYSNLKYIINRMLH